MNDIKKINQAIKEIENSTLSAEAKSIALKILKEQLRIMQIQNAKISNDIDFIQSGIKK